MLRGKNNQFLPTDENEEWDENESWEWESESDEDEIPDPFGPAPVKNGGTGVENGKPPVPLIRETNATPATNGHCGADDDEVSQCPLCFSFKYVFLVMVKSLKTAYFKSIELAKFPSVFSFFSYLLHRKRRS